MNRKDYVAVAAALAGTRPSGPGASYFDARAWDQWLFTRTALVSVLAFDNSRFDSNRFILATEA